MDERLMVIDGVAVPRFFYGTAWKEDRTEALTLEALRAGFRAIDTANQRRHYFEEGVGRAVRWALDERLVSSRVELFLQTKFTFRPSQDHRLPYDPSAPVAKQVVQSLSSSLEHLGTPYLDSYVLHGPSRREGLGPDDVQAWRAMEALHADGCTRFLGISNVSLGQLEALCDLANTRPRFVQNRCFAATGWDHGVRAYCRNNGIVYQGFSLLTANLGVISRPEVARLAARLGKTVPQVIFRFCVQVGMIVLTGTTNPQHMREDLDIFDFALNDEDVAMIESLGMQARW